MFYGKLTNKRYNILNSIGLILKYIFYVLLENTTATFKTISIYSNFQRLSFNVTHDYFYH